MKAIVRKTGQRRGGRGFVLVTATWIVIALTAVVLVLCREMSVESLTARQHLAQAKADAAEFGVEQYIMSVIEMEMVSPGYKDQVSWQGRQIGECYFWVLTPNPDYEDQPAYGLTDEGGKIDLNYTPEEMLEYLPGLEYDPSIAAAIVDWRDPDDIVTENIMTGSQGAETNYYQAAYGYNAKNALFESIGELRLVAGLTEPVDADYILWGADTNHNYTIDVNESTSSDTGMNFLTTMRGMMPYVTVYGYQATNPPDVTATVDTLGNISTATTTQPSTLDEITYYTPLDLNNADNMDLLQQLLSQFVTGNVNAIVQATQSRLQGSGGGGGGGGGGGTTGSTTNYFTNIWDWIATVNQNGQNITSEQLSTASWDGTPLFNLLTCLKPEDANANTDTSQPIVPDETNPTGAPPQTKFAKINVNSALIPALFCVFADAEYKAQVSQDPYSAALQDAENVVAIREQYPVSDPLQLPNISWLMDIIDLQVLAQAGPYLTGTSTVYSADIVTVSQDGRAFKRVKIVVDASAMVAAEVANQNSYLSGATTGTGLSSIGGVGTATSTGPVIVYRRDLTDAGWPMDPEIRRSLRRGELPIEAVTDTGTAGSTSSLTFGP